MPFGCVSTTTSSRSSKKKNLKILSSLILTKRKRRSKNLLLLIFDNENEVIYFNFINLDIYLYIYEGFTMGKYCDYSLNSNFNSNECPYFHYY